MTARIVGAGSDQAARVGYEGFKKLLCGAPGHATRFHTERGELIPLRAWLRLPLTVFERFTDIPSRRPWLIPAAIIHLESLLSKEWRVLELGSGGSTPWLEARCRELISYELDPDWYQRIRTQTKCDLRLVTEDQLLSSLASLPARSFDLVFVDVSGDRNRVLSEAAARVKPGGYLLLDNSDSLYTRAADHVLAGWKVRRFPGLAPFPLTAFETSIFERPRNLG